MDLWFDGLLMTEQTAMEMMSRFGIPANIQSLVVQFAEKPQRAVVTGKYGGRYVQLPGGGKKYLPKENQSKDSHIRNVRGFTDDLRTASGAEDLSVRNIMADWLEDSDNPRNVALGQAVRALASLSPESMADPVAVALARQPMNQVLRDRLGQHADSVMVDNDGFLHAELRSRDATDALVTSGLGPLVKHLTLQAGNGSGQDGRLSGGGCWVALRFAKASGIPKLTINSSIGDPQQGDAGAMSLRDLATTGAYPQLQQLRLHQFDFSRQVAGEVLAGSRAIDSVQHLDLSHCQADFQNSFLKALRQRRGKNPLPEIMV